MIFWAHYLLLAALVALASHQAWAELTGRD